MEDCLASSVYKVLGIPLLIQTPLLPPRYSLLPAICIHLHDFTMCISFVLTVLYDDAEETLPTQRYYTAR